MDSTDRPGISRRAVLRSAGGTAGLLTVGVGQTGAEGLTIGCPDASLGPDMDHFDHSLETVCADDHPATESIKADVADALENEFPTVGALIEAGFVPYFDFLGAEDGGDWSHWLNPEFIADDGVLDPERPESILVDHEYWRPIGVMFIATRDGESVAEPPAVYEAGSGEGDEDGEAACRPWHAHVGVPGRYAWWKYRMAYGQGVTTDTIQFPCETPWMLHVWAYSHPESVYAHGAPPRGNRGGPPAEEPGFSTDADPAEDDLSPEYLPDVLLNTLAHKDLV